MNLSNIYSEEVPPRADALVETFRAIGYSPETAIADLLDNSITAAARAIAIDFKWVGADSTVTISDNGNGMSGAALVNAMRPGSTNPLQTRAATDLGRFGLGLKTASFSQCRRLTVLSKPIGGAVEYRCWDLDHIGRTQGWYLLTWVSDSSLIQRLANMPHGTIVVWELADRLAGGLRTDSDRDRHKFNHMIERVQWHLEMVFHRYLQNGLVITINGNRLRPWDPFLTGRPGTQRLADEEPSPDIHVAPYVLPHHRLFATREEHEHAGRVKGWNAHQGFYIYRNDRLLVPGDWLGMFARDEHHKLARIAVSLPASLDHEWQIDIRKAQAKPPFFLRDRLRSIATVTRQRAAEVYRARGQKIQKLTGTPVTPVWQPEIKEGRTRYRLNREHPALQTVFDELGNSATATRLREALRFIEEAVPVPLIALNATEQPHFEAQPFEDEDREALELMRRIYQRKRKTGSTPEEARHYVARIDPFHQKPHLLEQLTD